MRKLLYLGLILLCYNFEILSQTEQKAEITRVFVLPEVTRFNKKYYLIGQKAQKRHKNMWTLIGGKVEKSDKNIIETAKREFTEETLGSFKNFVYNFDAIKPDKIVYLKDLNKAVLKIKLSEKDFNSGIKLFYSNLQVQEAEKIAEIEIGKLGLIKESDLRDYIKKNTGSVAALVFDASGRCKLENIKLRSSAYNILKLIK